MRGIYLKNLSYPYSFGRFIFLELPYPYSLFITPPKCKVYFLLPNLLQPQSLPDIPGMPTIMSGNSFIILLYRNPAA